VLEIVDVVLEEIQKKGQWSFVKYWLATKIAFEFYSRLLFLAHRLLLDG